MMILGVGSIIAVAETYRPIFCEPHGFEVKTDKVEGQARSDLLPFARENDADLIVMGNSANMALVRRLLSNTVLKTIKSADRPLLLSQ